MADRVGSGLRLASIVSVALAFGTLTGVSAAQSTDAEVLRVFTGRGIVVTSPAPLVRVSVSDPAVASASVVSPTQVLLSGVAPGRLAVPSRATDFGSSVCALA